MEYDLVEMYSSEILPRLEQLIMGTQCCQLDSQKLVQVLASLTSCKCLRWEGALEDNEIKALMVANPDLAPNITHLKFYYLYETMIQTIWDRFTNLQMLEIEFNVYVSDCLK